MFGAPGLVFTELGFCGLICDGFPFTPLVEGFPFTPFAVGLFGLIGVLGPVGIPGAVGAIGFGELGELTEGDVPATGCVAAAPGVAGDATPLAPPVGLAAAPVPAPAAWACSTLVEMIMA
jgi:hypothetical protein